MAEKKKLSTAEILAAARGGKAPPAPAAPAGDADDATAAAAAPAESSGDAGDAAPAPASKPASKPAAASGAGGRPSVADILAMARAKKGEGDAPVAKAATPKPAAAKPAAAKPAGDKAAKPAAKAGAKPADGKPAAAMARDTASILAAARAGAKPGPVSKADAPVPVRPAARPPAERAGAAEKPAAAKPALPALPPKPAKPTVAAKGAGKGAGKGGEEESRRGFLEMAVGSFMAAGFTALSVTGGLFTLGLARFLFPNVLAEPPSRFKVGFKEAFPSGKVETKYVAQYGVWVVNSDVAGTQQIYALKTVCTHLGCTPNWLEAEQKFKCPCHGSGFYKDGVNFEGPAPRPLERYAIKVADDGQLEIDKSRTYHEELGQWADPESFIPV